MSLYTKSIIDYLNDLYVRSSSSDVSSKRWDDVKTSYHNLQKENVSNTAVKAIFGGSLQVNRWIDASAWAKIALIRTLQIQ